MIAYFLVLNSERCTRNVEVYKYSYMFVHLDVCQAQSKFRTVSGGLI